MTRRRLPRQAAFNLTLLVGCVFWLLPLFISLTTALQPEFDVLAGLSVIPHHITFSNFSTAWEQGDLAQYYKNSLLIVATKVPLGVVLASLAAFPLARYRFRGRKAVLMLFLLGLGITPLVVLYPLTILLKDVGIGGSLWSLLFPYLAFGLPFEILVMRGAFLGYPVRTDRSRPRRRRRGAVDMGQSHNAARSSGGRFARATRRGGHLERVRYRAHPDKPAVSPDTSAWPFELRGHFLFQRVRTFCWDVHRTDPYDLGLRYTASPSGPGYSRGSAQVLNGSWALDGTDGRGILHATEWLAQLTRRSIGGSRVGD